MGENRFQCVWVLKKGTLITCSSAETINSGDTVAQYQVLRQDAC